MNAYVLKPGAGSSLPPQMLEIGQVSAGLRPIIAHGWPSIRGGAEKISTVVQERATIRAPVFDPFAGRDPQIIEASVRL